MKLLRTGVTATLLASLILITTGRSLSAVEATVPVSAKLGTAIAGSLFPISVKLDTYSLLFTDPVLVFIDEQRLGMRARLQAYVHQPAEGIAISEMGSVLFSGKVDYDPASRHVLLHEPTLDDLEFDRDSKTTRNFHAEFIAAWSEEITDPMRSEIPPHPYILPFKDSIQDLSYDGQNINIDVTY